MLSRDFKPSLRVIKDKDEKILTEENDILEIWNEYYTGMYKAVNDPTNSKKENTVNDREPEPLLDEVSWAIGKVKKGKSPGCKSVTDLKPQKHHEKCREHNIDLFVCFIDYSMAFDCVQHYILWKAVIEMGFSTHIIIVITILYKEQQAAVRVRGRCHNG